MDTIWILLLVLVFVAVVSMLYKSNMLSKKESKADALTKVDNKCDKLRKDLDDLKAYCNATPSPGDVAVLGFKQDCTKIDEAQKALDDCQNSIKSITV
jgi:peptidoglycan hydrolase CwlO-like protein